MYVVVFIIISTYFIFIIRLFDLQFIKHEAFLNEGIKQYSVNRQDHFTRGKIFFTKNNGEDVIASDIEEKIVKRNDKDIITRNRVYTYGDLAAKVLGFVAYDEHSRVGRYGIEKYYNDVLERESSKLYTNFFAEIFGDLESSLSTSTPRQEGNITLTIDVEAQKYLHTVLADTQKQWNSDNIGGIIMDPHDGRIIAMEELPTYDPNNFNIVENQSLFKNDLVSGVYEMGSIIKPITMASALDTGVVNENTFYNDSGFVMLNGRKVSNYDGVARGYINVQQILSQSLNVGTVFLVEKLGIEKFQGYLKKFGLGSETGIDLPNEASGLTGNLSSTVLVDSATAGFGQGIAITPIQTIRALAVLGNGGKLVNPYIVDKITYSTGVVKNITPDDGEQILSTTTSERITRMLVNVVDNSLVKGKKKMEHYSVAAKTGTAQMVAPNGKYYKDRYLHSFFGYFPAYDPKFIVFLYHTDPKGAQYASQTLTDPFFKIADFLISYYSIVPDR